MTASRAGLVHATRVLGTDLFEQLRAHAYANGRVLEHDGLTILGFGTAATLALPGGLTDPSVLSCAVADLAAIAPIGGIRPDTAVPGGHDEGAVPLALGALRFDRSADGELVVPELTVVAPRGREPFALIVGSHGRVAELANRLGGDLPEIVTGGGNLEPTSPPDEFPAGLGPTARGLLEPCRGGGGRDPQRQPRQARACPRGDGGGQPAAAPSRSARAAPGPASLVHGVRHRRVRRRHTRAPHQPEGRSPRLPSPGRDRGQERGRRSRPQGGGRARWRPTRSDRSTRPSSTRSPPPSAPWWRSSTCPRRRPSTSFAT